MTAPRTVGVEEEFLLVDEQGHPTAVAGAVLDAAPREVREGPDDVPGGGLEHELMLEQIETGTPPCPDLATLDAEIRAGRVRANEASAALGARIAAVGTSPVHVLGTRVPSRRYDRAAAQFGLTADEQLTSGCHVHVGVASRAEGVAVLDRIGPWLAPLLAISANSPFWQGVDTSYASYRAQVWSRWPTAGPVRTFGSVAAYDDAVARLLTTGTILDVGMIYFDARLSARYPTVEIRVADVCLAPATATLVAALARALVETAAREHADGLVPTALHPEVLRAAAWRASRSGLGDVLVDPATWAEASAHDVVGSLVEHVRPALEDAGDLDAVTELLGGLWARGGGARRQRAWFAESGDVLDVSRRAADATLG
ncbi:glutamate--cysteine ligase [Sanguibacter sp. HDW7]|uniref:carboxylate-amine ligase n=1 Tax=Sanguibacter sp. HDW7 TaxID=2714931 RepID=UPI001407257C|nr:glutamate--cysteine ligase [Sanguibacter sp. HDW7]QIK83405.1 YbdK family carboxylate-amine ligase [Sanguibacter sp. HDW7]